MHRCRSHLLQDQPLAMHKVALHLQLLLQDFRPARVRPVHCIMPHAGTRARNLCNLYPQATFLHKRRSHHLALS